jgi:epoxyqueuosine reductase QueG
LAKKFKTTARYPFGGPPYAPFIDWAEKSGRAFVSPVGMLVHDQVGMMISFRGALHFTAELDIPTPKGLSPCLRCVGQPCLTTCPVLALRAHTPYKLDVCHTFLDTSAGGECLANGCGVRLACPVSEGAGRLPVQSALHMKSFHPG